MLSTLIIKNFSSLPEIFLHFSKAAECDVMADAFNSIDFRSAGCYLPALGHVDASKCELFYFLITLVLFFPVLSSISPLSL